MNPKAGSFNIDHRLQRHYTVIGIDTPEQIVMSYIFTSML